jgi:predicted Rossmann-fold nucleotide-binding protein
MSFKRVLVFCGSSPGARPEYVEAGAALGGLLAERGLGLVYGGEVIGVIPRLLTEREVSHAGLSQLRVVETMHERKALMAELSDAVIALPGGCGTLDELFELLTWSQLGIHREPIGLLDVAGYWRPLLALLDHMVSERFLTAANRDMLLVDSDAGALLDRLAGFEYRDSEKWLDLQRPSPG